MLYCLPSVSLSFIHIQRETIIRDRLCSVAFWPFLYDQNFIGGGAGVVDGEGVTVKDA